MLEALFALGPMRVLVVAPWHLQEARLRLHDKINIGDKRQSDAVLFLPEAGIAENKLN